MRVPLVCLTAFPIVRFGFHFSHSNGSAMVNHRLPLPHTVHLRSFHNNNTVTKTANYHKDRELPLFLKVTYFPGRGINF